MREPLESERCTKSLTKELETQISELNQKLQHLFSFSPQEVASVKGILAFF